MRLLLVPLLAAVVLGPSPAVRAADDPKALIEKAVKAMGGADSLAQCTAVRMRVKGAYELDVGGPAGKMTFQGEMFQQPGGVMKLTWDIDLGGNKMKVTMVSNGDKSWMAQNGMVSEVPNLTKEYREQTAHLERVTGLLPLLRDKGFTLSALGESKVEDRAVLGVKVVHKGMPDISLYFDKETGLLVKHGYRGKLPGQNTEVLTEAVLRDYREVDLGAADEAALKAAKVGTDGPALLKYLRGLIPDPAKIAEAKKLIKQLGDDSFDVREKASEELIKLGRLAVPLLQAALKDDDREVARRAEDCLQRIDEQSGNATAISAVRLLAVKRPAGAVEALLEYLPSAEEPVAREVKAALVVLSVKDGKADPALTKALDDKDPLRRKVAAAVLGKDGGAYLKEAGRRVYPRGLKTPRKTTHYQDGKKTTEMEVVEAEYFNRFDDKVFARP